jgi:hypothetical protein
MTTLLRPFYKNAKGALGGYYFYCPGCKEVHQIAITPNVNEFGQTWELTNKNVKSPTITPSILSTIKRLIVDNKQENSNVEQTKIQQENNDNSEQENTVKELVKDNILTSVCHFNITDGKIEFLPNSTHELSGQIVDMLDMDKQ